MPIVSASAATNVKLGCVLSTRSASRHQRIGRFQAFGRIDRSMTDPHEGKRGLVIGVANDHSIAWGIAKTLSPHGATLALHVASRGEALVPASSRWRNRSAARSCCPATSRISPTVDAVFAPRSRSKWGTMDFLCTRHLAFPTKNELKGRYADTTRANFQRTMVISCFSFTECAKRAAALMPNGGSMITLTYNAATDHSRTTTSWAWRKRALEGSVRYLAVDFGPQKIRVNAISAGPIRTLAGAGINDARYMFAFQQRAFAARPRVTLDDLGGAGLYLLSDLSAASPAKSISSIPATTSSPCRSRTRCARSATKPRTPRSRRRAGRLPRLALSVPSP